MSSDGESCTHNKGEITAFQTTTMAVFAYKKGSHMYFIIDSGSVYEYEGRKTSVDAEDDFLRNTTMTVTCRSQIPQGYIQDNLMNVFFFIKFKVPYDKKYSYRQYAFHLREDVAGEKKQGKKSVWTLMNIEDSENIIKRFMISKELSPEVIRMKERFFGEGRGTSYNPPGKRKN